MITEFGEKRYWGKNGVKKRVPGMSGSWRGIEERVEGRGMRVTVKGRELRERIGEKY